MNRSPFFTRRAYSDSRDFACPMLIMVSFMVVNMTTLVGRVNNHHQRWWPEAAVPYVRDGGNRRTYPAPSSFPLRHLLMLCRLSRALTVRPGHSTGANCPRTCMTFACILSLSG